MVSSHEEASPGAGLNNFTNMLQAKCISESRGPTIIESDISQSQIGSMKEDLEPYESLVMVRRTCAPHARHPYIRLSARHGARLAPFTSHCRMPLRYSTCALKDVFVFLKSLGLNLLQESGTTKEI